MDENILDATVRRASRSRILSSVLILLIVVGCLALFWRYFYNFVLGPFPSTRAALEAISSASDPQQYWLNVSGEQLINTGIQYVSTSSKTSAETIEATYFGLILDERILLVKVPGDIQEDTRPPELTGWLETLSKDEQTDVIEALEKESPSIKGLFLPYKLETGDFRLNGIFGLILVGVIGAVCLWFIFQGIGWTLNPNTHPGMKALARFGPLELVKSQIELELAGPHTTLDKLHLTSAWLVFTGSPALAATRYADVAWVYKHVLTQRSYGIPINKVYTAVVYDRHGTKLDLTAGRKEKAVDEFLQAIVERAPWAVVGFTNEIESAWKKDRAAFLTAVERRKSGVDLA